jgi:hypothetical protein
MRRALSAEQKGFQSSESGAARAPIDQQPLFSLFFDGRAKSNEAAEGESV